MINITISNWFDNSLRLVQAKKAEPTRPGWKSQVRLSHSLAAYDGKGLSNELSCSNLKELVSILHLRKVLQGINDNLC